jgi:hypothetical protein
MFSGDHKCKISRSFVAMGAPCITTAPPPTTMNSTLASSSRSSKSVAFGGSVNVRSHAVVRTAPSSGQCGMTE